MGIISVFKKTLASLALLSLASIAQAQSADVTVTFPSAPTEYRNNGGAQIPIRFSEPVTGFVREDISVITVGSDYST